MTSPEEQAAEAAPTTGGLAPDATAWIVDASVALKWFLPVDREPDGELARSAIGKLAMRTTTLAVHEVGNILTRRSGWGAERVAAGLQSAARDLRRPRGARPRGPPPRRAVALEHDLTFYDASYVAIARRTQRGLLSADGDLLAPRLALPLQDALG